MALDERRRFLVNVSALLAPTYASNAKSVTEVRPIGMLHRGSISREGRPA